MHTESQNNEKQVFADFLLSFNKAFGDAGWSEQAASAAPFPTCGMTTMP